MFAIDVTACEPALPATPARERGAPVAGALTPPRDRSGSGYAALRSWWRAATRRHTTAGSCKGSTRTTARVATTPPKPYAAARLNDRAPTVTATIASTTITTTPVRISRSPKAALKRSREATTAW